ncbi:hypothetical protein [Streptomyces sp. NBC_00989]|uniref:hypothetical protein n=1 Tax=Streptomyces sp. NBC_00989 TaxID=2903705 RepID=UPI00387049A9|nr:hypothetical protein OG714_35095 [Streptomyces sp. NBC_00989]
MGRGLAIATAPARRTVRPLGVAVTVAVEVTAVATATAAGPPASAALPPRGASLRRTVLVARLTRVVAYGTGPGVGCVDCTCVGLS